MTLDTLSEPRCDKDSRYRIEAMAIIGCVRSVPSIDAVALVEAKLRVAHARGEFEGAMAEVRKAAAITGWSG